VTQPSLASREPLLALRRQLACMVGDAQQAGLIVSHTAAERSNDALIDALLEFRDA
jgi:hypothetical protein